MIVAMKLLFKFVVWGMAIFALGDIPEAWSKEWLAIFVTMIGTDIYYIVFKS